MANELKGACIIGQSGGPTAVINASAYGVIKTALESEAITRVYGAAHAPEVRKKQPAAGITGNRI